MPREPEAAQTTRQYECIQELPNGRWHIVAGPSDREASWRPIMCGEGIVFPGNSQRREPTCDGCVMAIAARVRP